MTFTEKERWTLINALVLAKLTYQDAAKAVQNLNIRAAEVLNGQAKDVQQLAERIGRED